MASFRVLIMTSCPVLLSFWPTNWLVFPRRMTTKRRQIKACPVTAKLFDTTLIGVIRPVDVVSIPKKDTGHVVLALSIGGIEVVIEITVQ